MSEVELHPAAYSAKQDGYYEQERRELLPFVPPDVRRALDVGCGVGAFGALLKKERAAEVWGIEPHEAACEVASSRLDRVLSGSLELNLERLPERSFDLICFNDVLEHLLEPELALRKVAPLLTERGTLLASIPNFRYFPNLWEIVWKGEWEYKKSGVLDATHLRFFTRKSMVRLFESTGYRVLGVHGIAPWRSWKLSLLRRLSLGTLDDTPFQAFVVLARRE